IVGKPLNEAWPFLLRARVYESVGDHDKSARELKMAPKPIEGKLDELMVRGSALFQLRLTEYALADLDKALQIDPNSTSTLLLRATLFVEQQQWKYAAQDVAKFVNLKQEGEWAFKLAPLLVREGELDGYHRHCQLLIERYRTTNDPMMAERAAKACLFLPP